MARLQRIVERILDDEPAARAVYDANTLPAFGKRRGIDDVARLVGQRRVQGNEVRAPEDFVEFNLFDTDGSGIPRSSLFNVI